MILCPEHTTDVRQLTSTTSYFPKACVKPYGRDESWGEGSIKWYFSSSKKTPIIFKFKSKMDIFMFKMFKCNVYMTSQKKGKSRLQTQCEEIELESFLPPVKSLCSSPLW